MLEQELKNIWNNSSQTNLISIETPQLINELNVKMSSIQKVIRRRDTGEISASVVGIIIFTFLLYEIPFPMTKFACGLSITWFVFVILKFRKSKIKNATSPLDISVNEQLTHQEDAMQYQADLLNSVAYWYAIPPFIINCVFITGLGSPTDFNWSNNLAESILPLTINFKIITIIGLAFFYAFIIWLNKRAVNTTISPLIGRIKTVKQQLKLD